MKKIMIMGVFALVANNTNAQQWAGSTTTSGDIYRDGHVGIGLSSAPAYHFVVADPTANTGVQAIFGGTQIVSAPWIGGSATVHELQSTTSSVYTAVSNYNAGAGSYDDLWFGTTNTFHAIVCKGVNKATMPFDIFMKDDVSGSNFSALRVWPTGQIGIGTATTSLGTDTKLAVEGLIACHELKVIPSGNPWPDYVFAKDYKLMSLREVESYINNNSHLPQLPSAATVEKDGFKIAETQTQMLQALEELYLHVIDLKKENELLKKEISSLKK